MRGQDNFINPYQYLMEQIFPYNFSITSESDILKQKLWVLDSDITSQDASNGIIDNNYNNPLNHYAWLSRELNFLEYYRKTKDNIAGPSENFNDKKENAITIKEEYLKKINPNTGNLYNDYEIPYEVRPTYLTDEQFEILYQKLKEKMSQSPSIIVTAPSILTGISNTIPLDNHIISQTNGVNNALSPNQIVANAVAAAYKLKSDKDDLYVQQLNNMWLELWEIVKSLKEEAESKKPEKPDDDNIGWANETIGVWNWPAIRAIVDPSNSGTFYGMNNDPQFPTEKGYHYFVWDMISNDINPDVSYETIKAINDGSAWLPAMAYSKDNYPMLSSIVQQLLEIHGSAPINHLMQPNLDWFGFTFFFIGFYYEETTISTSNSESSEATKFVEKKLKVLADMSNLPVEDGTEETKGAKTWNRFAQLHKNWCVINNLRENAMNGMGTRSQVEMMAGLANPPDMRPFLTNTLNVTISQKDVTTQYLKNTTSEFK